MAPILKIPRQEYSARRRFNEGAAYEETSPKTFSSDTTTSSNVIFITEAEGDWWVLESGWCLAKKMFTLKIIIKMAESSSHF